MMNLIWSLLVIIGIIVSIINGQIEELASSIFQASTNTMEIAIRLAGPMALWSGMLKIAREADLTKLMAKIIKPVFKLIFPEIVDDDAALGAILLNISANIMGLGNSATPLGIKAMKELQRLNKDHRRASRAMCTLLALNTSSLTIIPATVISLRAASGSVNPALITVTTIFATSISTLTAIFMDKTFRIFTRE